MSGKLVLCVEDESEILDYLGVIASTAGFEPILCLSAKEALERCNSLPEAPAAVISDYAMPNMNGLTLRAKLYSKYPDVPFCVLSGNIRPEMLRYGSELRIARFINKPFSRSDIVTFLADVESGQIDLSKPPTLPNDEPLESKSIENESTDKENSHQPNNTFSYATETVDMLAKQEATNAEQSKHAPLNLVHDSLSPASKQKDSSTEDKESTGSSQTKDKKSDAVSSIVKVDARLLDEFMESAGELTVVRNIVNKLIRDLERKYPNCESVSLLFELLDDMHKLTSEVQTKIHELRLVNIGEICKTYPRIVRDLGKKLSKEIGFNVEGEDVLVDNGHAKVLTECLIHLIRNSADHGLETAEERLKAGKPAKGTIQVSALRQDSNVVIQVSDDGKGINTAKVGQKAIERGLITAQALSTMNTQQINELIFKPGFSTADQVTDISGRGVGMDMVFNSIKALGGETELNATAGRGTTFRLKLPDPGKANIIEALLIQAGGEHFAIPQSQVVRAYEVSKQQHDRYFRKAGGVTLFLNKANQLMPIVSLAELLKLTTEETEIKTYIELNSGNHQYCLQVDCILDTEEIVTRKIKTLKDQLSIFLGVTFVGVDGLCLILDTDKLAEFAGVVNNTQHNLKKVAEHYYSFSQAGLNSNEHLLVSAFGGKTVALNLHDIDRLERIPKNQVQQTHSGAVVLYHGKTTLLRHLNQIVSQTASHNTNSSEHNANQNFATQTLTPNHAALGTKEEIDVVAFNSPGGWVLIQIEEIIDAFYPEDIQFTADGSGYAVAKQCSYPIIPLLELLKKQKIIEVPKGQIAPTEKSSDMQNQPPTVDETNRPVNIVQEGFSPVNCGRLFA